jgi:hypothetical protein
MMHPPMRWFGAEYWGPPCTGPHVEPPIGQECCYCGEPFVGGEYGAFAPIFDMDGEPAEAPIHAPCFIRLAYGSVRHQRGECLRGHGTCNDLPEGMTRRSDAALAASYFLDRIGRMRALKKARTN